MNKPVAEYTISTIAPVGRIKWRPYRKYHLASSALVLDSAINVWDVRRPYIPYASFAKHTDVATCIAWKGDPFILLSTNRVIDHLTFIKTWFNFVFIFFFNKRHTRIVCCIKISSVKQICL